MSQCTARRRTTDEREPPTRRDEEEKSEEEQVYVHREPPSKEKDPPRLPVVGGPHEVGGSLLYKSWKRLSRTLAIPVPGEL